MESAEDRFKQAAETLSELRKRVGELKAEMKELASRYALEPSPEVMESFTEVHRRERVLVDLLRGVDAEVKRLMSAKSRELRARRDEASARRQERQERQRQREEQARKAKAERRKKREQRKEEIRREVIAEFEDEHDRPVMPGEERQLNEEIRKRPAEAPPPTS